jgi:hypothetical protein
LVEGVVVNGVAVSDQARCRAWWSLVLTLKMLDFLPWQAVNRTETETAAVAMVANFLNLETDT